jgi:hypothetical protein
MLEKTKNYNNNIIQEQQPNEYNRIFQLLYKKIPQPQRGAIDPTIPTLHHTSTNSSNQ